jgi:ADP-heptose:LPS heptosyltransferase
VDLLGRLLLEAGRLLRAPASPPRPAEPPREVLVLRLDRIGDVIMSLPALFALRAALPAARIRLAVGRWSEDVARLAPVDEVLVWSAPWVGRRSEGAGGLGQIVAHARSLRRAPIDLGLDLQGDLRAGALLWLSGARRRVGYANTGGAWLLTDVVDLDETVSWVEQNHRAVDAALGRAGERAGFTPLPDDLCARGREILARLGLGDRRPLVGIHPSGGRRVKQWDPERWAQVASRLAAEQKATIVVTGSAADASLARIVARGLGESAVDLTGRLSVAETMALISALDLLLSPDTGPMHMACAAGTPSVAVFGPSDPARYFSGGDGRPPGRHVVVRAELWCSPCNLIRKPPRECAGPEPPECLRLVGAEEVYRAAVAALRASTPAAS